ncbi:EcsC family protein [Propioniciclava soli]|uniref:EcsC family protein n=1 Tax=Propioniciclava soli TaxID=2775081 RepID=A0ABZ3C667_9ACTN|nr:EcsC family protein [Propioniciclava soli]
MANARDVSKTLAARGPEMGGNVLRQLLETAINGMGVVPGAKATAANHLVKRNGVEDALDALVRTHVGLATAQGVVTNIGGLATLAVALPTNIAGVAVLQIRLVAAIAHLRGYDIDSPSVRTALTLCLMGAEGTQRLMDADVLPASPLVIATAPVFDASLDQVVCEKVFAELASRIGGRHAAVLIARRIPLIGGGVGGTLDAFSTLAVGTYAREQFVNRRRITQS